MAYQKHYFLTGGKIEAAPFNEMENQIAINEAAIDGKQDKLTFDSTPTAESANPITSGGVKAALDALAGDTRSVYRLTEVNFDNVVEAYNAFQNGCYVVREIPFDTYENILLPMTHALYDSSVSFYMMWFEITTDPIYRNGKTWQGYTDDSAKLIHSVCRIDASPNNAPSESLKHYVVCTPLEMSQFQDKLPDEYIAHLEEATFKRPSIVSLSIASMGGEVEIGTEITVDRITHDEENLQNIAGDFVLKHGDTVLAGQIPISSEPYTLDTPYHFTRRTAGTETITLSGTDTRGNTFSKSVSQRFYVPKFTGTSTSDTVTAEDILSMQRAKTLQSSVTVSGVAAYIYFVTDARINTIKSGGFDVPFVATEDVTVPINGIDVTYHIYHTENQAVPGSYSFEIS